MRGALLSLWLAAHGVRHIDGVDLTPEMLEQAHHRGVFASLLGLGAAWILLDALAPTLLEIGVQIAPPTASLELGSAAAAVTAGLVGSVPAALRAARLDPVEALR